MNTAFHRGNPTIARAEHSALMVEYKAWKETEKRADKTKQLSKQVEQDKLRNNGQQRLASLLTKERHRELMQQENERKRKRAEHQSRLDYVNKLVADENARKTTYVDNLAKQCKADLAKYDDTWKADMLKEMYGDNWERHQCQFF